MTDFGRQDTKNASSFGRERFLIRNPNYDLGVGVRQVGAALLEQDKQPSDLPRPYQVYPNLELLFFDFAILTPAQRLGILASDQEEKTGGVQKLSLWTPPQRIAE
ncbi:MAG: hypothetical protein HYR94_23775 [Chloroflexi bacterium]|nr:hypothetical protein [Chloroflexota bacterium]